MADSWIEELERLGLAWRMRSSPDAAVTIVSSRTVEVLSPDEAASAAVRLVSDPVSTAVTAAGLRGQPFSQTDLTSDASAIAEGLLSGKLIAFRVRSTPGISAGEAAAIEAMLASHSVPAPPPTRPPPNPNTPLHKYKVCVRADTGKPISGIKLKFEIEGTPRMQTTGGDGIVTVEWFSTARARVRILEEAQLEEQLEPQFDLPRSKQLPSGPGVYTLRVGRLLQEVSASADELTTIVLARNTIMMGIRLTDQDGEVLGQRRYRIEAVDGTVYEGVTDDEGCAEVDQLEAGTYSVSFPDYDNEHDWDWVEALPGNRTAAPSGPVVAEVAEAIAPNQAHTPANENPESATEQQEDSPEPTILPTEFAVRLVDPAGNPLRGMRVNVVTAAGDTVDGATNDEGVLRLPVSGAGACTVHLPDLDRRDWSASA